MTDRPIPDDLLRQMAETAFTVANWSKRMGFKREAQVEQIRRALEADRDGLPWPEPIGDFQRKEPA